MKGYKPADWGTSPSLIENTGGSRLFKAVDLSWSKPEILPKSGEVSKFSRDDSILYAVIRDHGKQQQTDNIRYIGLTMKPKTRFVVHAPIQKLAALKGTTRFSFAVVETKGKNKEPRTKAALEAIEHILMWALWSDGHELDNEKKQNMLPGLGTNGSSAWQIRNSGYRFSGRMPREIVYPWMLLKAGRNRSSR